MFKKLLLIIAASFVALSMAVNWQAFMEVREMGILAHLAAFSDHDHGVDDHALDHDEGHEGDHPIAATHTHKHRHSPSEPEHEHTHTNPGFVNMVAQASLTKASICSILRTPPVLEIQISLSHRIPPSQELSSLFRPPIC